MRAFFTIISTYLLFLPGCEWVWIVNGIFFFILDGEFIERRPDSTYSDFFGKITCNTRTLLNLIVQTIKIENELRYISQMPKCSHLLLFNKITY